MKLLKISFILTSICLYTAYVAAAYYDRPEKEQALLDAAQARDWNKAKQLINEGVNVNITDDTGHTVLHFAAQQGNLPVVKFLVEQGANVNVQSSWFNTPLDEAQKFNKTDVINYLKSKGARSKSER